MSEATFAMGSLAGIGAMTDALFQATSMMELASAGLDLEVTSGFASRAFLRFTRADGTVFEQIVTRNPAEAQAYQVRGLAGMVMSRALAAKAPLYLPDVSTQQDLADEAAVYEVELASVVCLPLGDAHAPCGALYLDRGLFEASFSPEDFELARHHARLFSQACTSLDRHELMTRRHDHLESLLGIFRTVSGVMELHTLLDHLTQMALTVIKAERAFVLLVDRDQLAYGAGRDREGVLPSSNFKRISHSVCQTVLETNKEVCVLDAGQDDSFAARQSVVNLQLQGVVAVPLIGRDGLLGILYIDSKNRTFDGLREEMKLLRALGAVASVVVENARMYQRVTVDNRTGLFTRALLGVRLDEEITRSRRYQRPCSLLVIALDGLSDIEAERGRDRAEVALRMVAQIVRTQARGGIDFPARFADDRLAVMLPETPLEGAWTLAERIRDKVSRSAFAGSEGQALSLTISVGAAAWRHPDGTAKELIDAAVEALNEAMEAGGDRTELAASSA